MKLVINFLQFNLFSEYIKHYLDTLSKDILSVLFILFTINKKYKSFKCIQRNFRKPSK